MNMKHATRVDRLTGAVLSLLVQGWASSAVALTATLTAGVHLRAGPSIVYPSVVIMPPGAVVQVFGCEQGFNWCDVQTGADRGWVDAAFLQAPSSSGPVIIANSAVTLGVPVVPFVFNTYWGNYYVGRPWYARRAHYFNYWNRFPHGRPPGGGRPGSGGRPPSSGRPPPGNQRPTPGSQRPPPGSGQ